MYIHFISSVPYYLLHRFLHTRVQVLYICKRVIISRFSDHTVCITVCLSVCHSLFCLSGLSLCIMCTRDPVLFSISLVSILACLSARPHNYYSDVSLAVALNYVKKQNKINTFNLSVRLVSLWNNIYLFLLFSTTLKIIENSSIVMY